LRLVDEAGDAVSKRQCRLLRQGTQNPSRDPWGTPGNLAEASVSYVGMPKKWVLVPCSACMCVVHQPGFPCQVWGDAQTQRCAHGLCPCALGPSSSSTSCSRSGRGRRGNVDCYVSGNVQDHDQGPVLVGPGGGRRPHGRRRRGSWTTPSLSGCRWLRQRQCRLPVSQSRRCHIAVKAAIA
jgi:hypothetical protein